MSGLTWQRQDLFDRLNKRT